jgi:acyl-CoA thioesterase II
VSFEADTRVSDDFTANVSPDWEIWGPNGGYLSTIALRAAARAAPPGHRPASIAVNYLARGEFGAAKLDVTVLRATRSVQFVRVDMRQGDRHVLTAQVVTTDRSEDSGPAYTDLKMPEVPPPDALPPASHWLKDEPAHAFWSHFDAHPVRWSWPGDPDPAGHVYRQWMRFRNHQTGDAFVDAARALLLIDTLLWPTHWRGQPPGTDYVAPSLDVAVWFHAPGADTDWLLLDAAAPTARSGLIYGEARVWSTGGTLLASGGSNMLVTPFHRA